MKISLALQPDRPLNKSEAWGCLTANLAFPGSGSLVAGRRAGYAQLILTAVGFLVTMLTGIRSLVWFLANWSRITQPANDDPFGGIVLWWTVVRWPLVGIAIFAIAMIWALGTSMQILRRATDAAVPPKIV